MGQVEANELKFWVDKIVRDPDMLPVFRMVGKQPVEETHCNIATYRICGGMGCHDLDSLSANDMHEYLEKNWITPYGSTQDRMTAAYNAALLGDLAVLAWKNKDGQGHVAAAAPYKPMLFSGKWGLYVPQVANVGGHRRDGEPNVGVMGANYGFSSLPDVFVRGKVVT